jgi:hypothetical protein
MTPEWPPDLVEAIVHQQSIPAHAVSRAALLLRRMIVLGIDPSAVEVAEPILLSDLDSACVNCTCGDVCDGDLTIDPDGRAWMDYCLNAVSLRALSGIGELRMPV